jgi:predicted Zn-ribbon and HTH transcriptional regulator
MRAKGDGMRRRPKAPAEPAERRRTVRRDIISLLTGRALSAREISEEAGVSEKEVCGHLEHIRKSLSQSTGPRLSVTPARCRKCGFVFRKRQRLQRPGRCPVCRGEQIEDPLFEIRAK